jgi:hypothetical protein
MLPKPLRCTVKMNSKSTQRNKKQALGPTPSPKRIPVKESKRALPLRPVRLATMEYLEIDPSSAHVMNADLLT